jgi:mono/diheme cytochrome c family protein
MRLKTLGVLLTTALAAFTMLYWFTDGIRREAVAVEQEEELLHFGEIIFSDDPSEPAAAGCAQCHGADGTGGDGGEDGNNVIGPNLHSSSLLAKIKANPNYVRLAVRYGGVVVSGNVESQMPAWSAEVVGPLNEQQIEAVVALVESWAAEAEGQEAEEVEDTAEAGAEVYAAQCASCHGAELEGGVGPGLQTIGSEVITDELPVVPSQVDQMEADYAEDPRVFLEKWIRDSATNYNDGQSTGMPPFPEDRLSESALRALITFLLEQTGEGE